VVEDIEFVEHGTVLPNGVTGAVGLRVRATDGGLRPPAPSSVEPSGTPTRPTDGAEPIPVGEEAEAAGPAEELVVAHVPDAFPTRPPPSKTEFEPDVLALDVPVFEDVPVVELSVPDGDPKDASGIEPPTPEHGVLVANPIGDVPDVVGLTPGDASSVAPRGMPVDATAEPGPMPSGDVMPSGGPGEICAKAEPHPKRTAAVVAIAKRVIVVDLKDSLRPPNSTNVITHPHVTMRRLPRLVRCCVRLSGAEGRSTEARDAEFAIVSYRR
jgi:hypothetical protein